MSFYHDSPSHIDRDLSHDLPSNNLLSTDKEKKESFHEGIPLNTFTPYLLSVRSVIQHYINRLTYHLMEQKKLNSLMKTTLSYNSDNIFIRFSLNRKLRLLNYLAFDYWSQQWKVYLYLLFYLFPNKDYRASPPIDPSKKQISTLPTHYFNFNAPLYLILTGSHKWPIPTTLSFDSLWNIYRIEKGTREASHYLLSSSIDLLLIDIDEKDAKSLKLCYLLREKQFHSPILAILMTRHHHKPAYINTVHQCCAINDYCYWPLKKQAWQAWLHRWLPNQLVTLSYIKRIH